MNIVVDTNIIFSAILSSKGKIGNLLLNSENRFEFFSTTFLLEELDTHHDKLKKISGINDSDIKYLKRILFNHIEFIDANLIHPDNWQNAYNLVKDIDEKDTPFVALSLEIQAHLWTGDKKLSKTLKHKGVDWILTTSELMTLRSK